MIGRRLGRRVRRVRRIRGRFLELARRSQRSVHLVGRHVKEAEARGDLDLAAFEILAGYLHGRGIPLMKMHREKVEEIDNPDEEFYNSEDDGDDDPVSERREFKFA